MAKCSFDVKKIRIYRSIEVTRIARVVVHPKYRTIGAGVKLVRESLPLCGKPYVEMIAVMSKYNPFAECSVGRFKFATCFWVAGYIQD